MDGMGDLDNTPMPPMGADDNEMGDPNMMGGDMPQDPNEDMMNSSDDDELMNIVNNMSTEDKAAVIKYAKSMVDDSEGDDMPQDPNMMGGEMPMESTVNLRSIIDETLNDILGSREDKGTKRPSKELPKEYKGKSPFIASQFKQI